MEGNKSFIMYIFVFLFIGAIMIFFVIPNSKEQVLSCVLETNETGINTIYGIESIYKNKKFVEVNIEMELDIKTYWIQKKDYIYSLEKDSTVWTDMGFDFKVEEDNENKKLIAKIYGDNEMLNEDLIYFSNIDDVKTHFEGLDYECEIGGLE